MNTSFDKDAVLNLSEAAAFCRVSRQTMAEEIRRGNVPAQKVGREFRVLKSSLIRFLSHDATVSPRAGNVAIVGTQTLTTLEPFLFESAPPTLQTIAEFDRLCDALVLHDDLIVIASGSDDPTPVLVDAFSEFVKTKSFKELRAELDEELFRKAFEKELLETVGNLGYVSPDQVVSKGIPNRDRAAGAFQEQVLSIMTAYRPDMLRDQLQTFIQDTFSKSLGTTFSSDVNYFLRTFLYNSVAKLKAWSFVPNLVRGTVLTVLGGSQAKTLLYSFMSAAADSLDKLIDFRDWAANGKRTPVRSPVAHVVLDQAETPADILRVALRIRDEMAPVRHEFTNLVSSVGLANNIGEAASAVDAFESTLSAAQESINWSDGSGILPKALTRTFIESLRLTLRIPGGFAVGVSLESMKKMFATQRVAPLMAFYDSVARSADIPITLNRLYGLDSLKEDPQQDRLINSLLTILYQEAQ